jgi:membrane protease YdiL (CAAX protease family)
MRAPSLNTLTILGFMLFWLLLVGGIGLAARWSPRARRVWQVLLPHWRPALAIALLFAGALLLGQGVSANGLLGVAVMAPAVWCQAIVGLALARSIPKFEPLPVARAVQTRNHVLRHVAVMLMVAFAVVLATVAASILGTNVAHSLLGETVPQTNSASFFSGNKALTFFTLLAGAGIFEETLFRLVVLSLIWQLTRSRWVAIVLAAVAFGAYHLTPLDSFYLTFWQHPWTQFLSATFSGLVLGVVYTWKGYETAVLGHTLSDWLPLLLIAP